MSEPRSIRVPRVRELVFGLCTAWLLLQNLVLFVLIAWQPLSGIRIATLVLLRVAIRAATPVTGLPVTDAIDLARLLLAAGNGVLHV